MLDPETPDSGQQNFRVRDLPNSSTCRDEGKGDSGHLPRCCQFGAYLREDAGTLEPLQTDPLDTMKAVVWVNLHRSSWQKGFPHG
jgi:hypothetical protein